MPVVDPKTIDAEVDAMLRGSVAHQVLFKFYSGIPKELGCEQVSEAVLDDALRFLQRCFEDALRGGVRLELTDLQRLLANPARQFLRQRLHVDNAWAEGEPHDALPVDEDANLRLADDETKALHRRAELEHRSMQEVARQAIREYVENHSRAELLDRVLDEELPRYAEALERLGQ